MVSFFEATILGIVQGITEWLPISSSGHLVLLHNLFNISPPVIFDVVLHLGSLVVVLAVFWKDIVRLVKGIFRREKYYLKYFLWLIIASIPIALVGFFLNDLITELFNDLKVVGFGFLFTAILLFLSRYPSKKEKNVGWFSAVLIGMFQALAILPGVSRSGATISSGLFQGISRQEAARFSFLLFIPAIVGATMVELPHLSEITDFSSLILGTIVSMGVGFISLRLLLKLVLNHKFHHFAWYCLMVGVITLVVAF